MKAIATSSQMWTGVTDALLAASGSPASEF
jgi:hypothetical protein